MSEHQLHSCNEDNCFVCRGGLSFCEVCKGAEASLPTDCPGRRLTHTEEDAIVAGALNFVDGQWKETR